jgi:hypothetical protein
MKRFKLNHAQSVSEIMIFANARQASELRMGASSLTVT